MKIDAVLSPAEIAQIPKRDLSGTTCVVFDILRATSSIVTALANGAREIYPVLTIEEALALRKELPEAALGGERHGDRIEGFDLGNSPAEYATNPPARIITTTTNGTVALRACGGAGEILAGALLNLEALVSRLRTQPPAGLLLVCAGTFDALALEDVFAAGMLCAALPREWLRTDGARTCESVYAEHRADALALLEASRNGRVLIASGRHEDVRWCARESVYAVIGTMKGGVILREDV